ncbi:MAG: zinc ribbon domain-containing protein [Candidatus Odinarchaeota archaeon]
MVQDPNDMMFCNQCKMNVFPSRPKFNIIIYVIFAIIFLGIFTAITIISLSFFSDLFLFIFFMWGFMIINPYLLYFGLQKKDSCPRCYTKTSEKNLKYKPFGEKESEIYRELTPLKKTIENFYCPYCGHSLNKGALFCGSCGKKLELFK